MRKATDIVLSTKEKQWQGQLDSLPPNDRPLWNCVNRYVRKGLGSSSAGARQKGVTLFLAHPNGFPKEVGCALVGNIVPHLSRLTLLETQTWEPGLERLVAEYSANANYQVDEIWAWEAANHGDACLVNNANLGGICVFVLLK